MTIATPADLTAVLKAAQPGDTIQLRNGNYPGTYDLRIPNVTIEPIPNERPIFTGPPKPVAGAKPAWLKAWPTAQGAILRDLEFKRLGEIAEAKAYNDWGIIVSAPDVTVDTCRLSGMTKGIQIEGKTSTGATIIHCHIGPTYQANIVVGASENVVRGALIGWNTLEGSYIEDAVQMVQKFVEGQDNSADVSNLGCIIYGNMISGHGENAIDLKGAALVVVEGNTIRHIAGSNDGPLTGWAPDSPMSIMHGARASVGAVCQVLVRNNDIQECAGGIRVYAGWKVVHNTVIANNFSKSPTPHEGTGILQQGDSTSAAIKNNFVAGNKGADVKCEDSSPEFINNPPFAGEGIALTATRGAGSGDTLALVDAGYFTDWFGRDDLPPDVLWLGADAYLVRQVDYAANTVRLDRPATWEDAQPVFWRSPTPVVGFQVEYTSPPIEPPVEPIEPPVIVVPPEPTEPKTVTITLTLSVDATVEQAQAIKDAVEAGAVSVDVAYNGVTVAGAVEETALGN